MTMQTGEEEQEEGNRPRFWFSKVIFWFVESTRKHFTVHGGWRRASPLLAMRRRRHLEITMCGSPEGRQGEKCKNADRGPPRWAVKNVKSFPFGKTICIFILCVALSLLQFLLDPCSSERNCLP
jgi:hypothetical protein